MTPADADEWGLGVLSGTVRLTPVSPVWRAVAEGLIDDVRSALGSDASAVEHIGSTAISGMLAKPIIDIGIRLAPSAQTEVVVGALEGLGYEYRGDAGDGGGLVFVMNVRPRVRVAHLHAIAPGDPQWDRYLAFVERLRTDPIARAAYGDAKRRLAAAHPDGRQAYTAGKSAIVERLLPRP